MDTPSTACLCGLPDELLFQIYNELDYRSILRLSAASRLLLSLSKSDDVIRTIVRKVVGLDVTDELRQMETQAGLSYVEQAKFIVPLSRHLGYFASSTPYTSRIIRMKLSYEPTTGLTDRAYELTLSASQLVITHDATLEVELPHNCVFDRLDASSYFVPRESISPDAGLSVDLLHPTYSFTPLFKMTSTTGSLALSSEGLKLKLLPAERRIMSQDSETPGARARLDSDAMYSLFTGRAPKRIWPTLNLLGSVSQSQRSLGCLRGAHDWVTARGETEPVYATLAVEEGEGEERLVKGFHLQLSRVITESSITPLPGSFPVDATIGNGPRRGVPRNGGPAILFQGDDEERVERQRDRDFVLQLANDNVIGEEIIRRAEEQFYPIIAPSAPLQATDESAVDEDGEILAGSIEGLYAGSYGPHGIEILHISIDLTRIKEDSAVGDEPITLRSLDATSASVTSSELQPGRYTRRIKAIKVTGDTNVPSGEFSWIGALPDIDIQDGELNLGTVPTVTNEELLRWSVPGPDQTRHWDRGVIAGAGRVAASGFVSASWTSAVITFIRSSHTFPAVASETQDGEDARMGEPVTLDRVEELRLSWGEMGKVSIFKRIRL